MLLRADLRERPLVDNEVTMARAALRVGTAMAVPVVGVAALLRGAPGAMTALGVLVFVVGTFVASGHALGWAAPLGPGVYGAVALGAFGVRLAMATVLLATLIPLGVLDTPVLVSVLPIAVVLLLTFEVLFVLRRPQMWHVVLPAPADDVSTHASKDCA